MCDVCISGCADLHLLDMLSPMERKRQGYIHELIVTEENYVNDLQLVTEVNTQDNKGNPVSSEAVIVMRDENEKKKKHTHHQQ